MGRLLTGIMAFCNWVTHFAILNLLWIGCTFLGLIVFGIGPSTIAMYGVCRQVALGDKDVPVIKTFWSIYKKELVKGNLFYYTFVFIGAICFYNLFFFRQLDGGFFTVINVMMMITVFAFLIMVMYVIPVYVHYKLKFFENFKQALLIGFLRPANLFLMIICSLSSYYFFIYFPGFIPIYGFTLFTQMNMWLAMKCFEDIEQYKAARPVNV